MDFRKELAELINKHSQENNSNTPDFVLANFLIGSLAAFDIAVNQREYFFGREPVDLSDTQKGIILDK